MKELQSLGLDITTLDKDNNPISLSEFGQKFEPDDEDYLRL